MAFDQGCAKLLFEFADLRAQRGLADVTVIGGAREMPEFIQGHEVFKHAKIHASIIAASYQLYKNNQFEKEGGRTDHMLRSATVAGPFLIYYVVLSGVN